MTSALSGSDDGFNDEPHGGPHDGGGSRGSSPRIEHGPYSSAPIRATHNNPEPSTDRPPQFAPSESAHRQPIIQFQPLTQAADSSGMADGQLDDPYNQFVDFDERNLDNPSNPHATRVVRKQRVWPRVLICLIVIALFATGGGWGWHLWQTEWRPIYVTVNGDEVRTRVNTTVAELLTANQNFRAKPGRLIAIDGSTINETGGNPITVTVAGQSVDAASQTSQIVPENATIKVESGTDVTEEHDVRKDPVPFSTDRISLVGGPIQRLKTLGKNGLREVWIGRESGKEVSKDVVEQPTDMVVDAPILRPDGRKVIALTFDDGPSQYSAGVLDVLKEKNVKATFFDVGQQSIAFPDAERRMVAEGHQVASHSNTHPNMPDLDDAALRKDITDGFANIKNASSVDTKVLRSPYGAFGVKQWAVTGDLISMNVLWDIDTEDWKMPGENAIHDAVMSGAHNGAIVLMHDGGGDRTQTVAALPRIIDDLKAQGYEFVTVDQLLQMSGV